MKEKTFAKQFSFKQMVNQTWITKGKDTVKTEFKRTFNETKRKKKTFIFCCINLINHLSFMPTEQTIVWPHIQWKNGL